MLLVAKLIYTTTSALKYSNFLDMVKVKDESIISPKIIIFKYKILYIMIVGFGMNQLILLLYYQSL